VPFIVSVLLRTVDPRGIEHHTEYDSRERPVVQVHAAQ
jgi:YD repeat-containing protein